MAPTFAATLLRRYFSTSSSSAITSAGGNPIPFKSNTINPRLSSSPSIILSLALLNSRRRKKLRKKLNSPRVRPINPNPTSATLSAALETILHRDSEFRFLTRARHYLSTLPPSFSLPLSDAGKLYRELGFPRGRKVSRSAARHPLLFSLAPVVDENFKQVPSISLTPLMVSLIDEERRIFYSMEKQRMETLKKLLMIVNGHRIPLAKLHHCRLIFGFASDLRDRVRKYPDVFQIVVEPSSNLHVLELVSWDSSLAVSAIEKLFVTDEQRVRRIFSFAVPHSKCLELDEDDRSQLDSISTLPLVSPYNVEGRKFEPWTVESEKYRVGVLHEFLSLTLEKKASIHHIMEFKEELSLTRHTYQMLVKQPRAFFLAGTAMNWTVFLKEGYREDGTLIEKDPQVIFEEELRDTRA